MAIRVFPILGLLALLLSFGDVRAQHVQIERVATGGGQTRLTFTFSWPSSLQSALDSAAVSSLDVRAVAAVTGTMFDAAESVTLSQLGVPGATVVESAFDEVPLVPGGDVDSLLALLTSPFVEAGWPGVSADEFLATVRVRTVTYDLSRQMLRRYRRVVVDVMPPVGSAGKTSASLLRADNPHLSVTRSVLADGFIIKIPVRTEGVYRINASYLNSALSGSGISVADLDPGSIKLYGNDGKPLPALNSAPRPADLVENPVLVTGSGNNLSIVFFARGPQGWTYESETGRWIHHTHPFSNDNYYFLKVDAGSSNGRRVSSAQDPGSAGATVLSEVVGRHLKEYDDLMWSKDSGTGHTWVSQQIQSNQQFDVFANAPLPGLAAGTVRYRARIAQRTHTTNRGPMVRFSSNGTALGSVAAGAVSKAEESPIARAAELEFTQENAAGSPLNLVMALDDHPEGPTAALDWIRVFYPKQLRATDGYLRFVTPADQSGVFEFVLSGFSTAPTVWDVTQIDDVRALNVTGSGNSYSVRVSATAGAPREIVAFTEQPIRVPEAPTRVENQNLHGIASYPDFVIVAPDTFTVFADELADRRRQEGLVVEIADVQHIYNEFSGGAPDMRAVRDYFKFLYDRGLEAGRPFRYALLFGDGHYNFRDLGSPAPELNNWIFPYETEESYDPIHSYTSDDYFGLLDDHEGIWEYRRPANELGERVDIGIGRFTVQSSAEARAVIEKIKLYESPENRGAWRMRYTFVADDGHNGLAGNLENTPDLHTQNIDVVADQVLADYPLLNQKKIYGISYPRVFLTTWRQPEVRRDLLAAINSGSLIVNYSGHGGEDGLAQEQIFTREDAASLTNLDRLPIVVTATCSFGRWDLSDDQSGAEVLHLNDRGGAVALLTTVRLVYTSASTGSLNVGLNLALNRAMMELDENGRPRRLGDILRITKNTREGLDPNNRKFNLLGDPTMRVGLPEPRVAVETVNGQPLTDQPVQVRALDKVTITGSVNDASGNLDETFGGPVNLTVFDAQRRIPVENASVLRGGYYTVREDLIWRGEVKAEAGRYSATFVVPKDISYSNQRGKISAYALEDGMDAGGFTTNVIVGGSSATPPNDVAGPALSLFMNDTTFVSGGMTTPTPELIVKLSDESGINTVGAGVGHEMLLVIDGNEQRATNIGEYYQSEENSYQRGTVRFPVEVYLKEQNEDRLAPGLHTVEVRAWDVLNNSSSASLDFYVAESEELALRNVLNYPNPLSRDTRFIFEHNKVPGTPARIQIRIYSLSGRPVRTLDREQTLPAGVLPGGQIDVYWDGRDEDFDLVGTGIYLYKVRVEVDNGDETEVVEHIEKLAVIR